MKVIDNLNVSFHKEVVLGHRKPHSLTFCLQLFSQHRIAPLDRDHKAHKILTIGPL